MEDLQKSIQISLCYKQIEIEDIKKYPQDYYICILKDYRYDLSQIIKTCDRKEFTSERAVASQLKVEIDTLIAACLLK